MISEGPDIYNALLANYISFERLYAMTIPAFYGDRKDTSEINIFIDLNSFLKRIWDPRKYSYKADNALTASIINACAHYRYYFWSRHMIKTKIYLVWGYNLPSYQSDEYNAHFRERVATMKEAQDLLEINKSALEFLCQYLPQIYFIDGGMHEVAAIIHTLTRDDLRPNIIISRDVYAYQLVAYCPNTFLYRPKKRYIDNKLIDASWVVMKSNLFRAMRHEMDYKQTADSPTNVRHLGYVLAMCGLRARHIKGIMTFNRACETVMAIEEDRPDDIDTIQNLEYIVTVDPPDRCRGIGFVGNGDLVKRYNTLDLINASNMVKADPKYLSMLSGIQDLYNPQGVMEINDKEFEAYPLELMEL